MSHHHASGTDGYRIHINPDGSAVFCEGLPRISFPWVLDQGSGPAIDKCCRKRNLVFTPPDKFNDPRKARLKRLLRIIRLEQRFAGVPTW